MLKDPKNRFAIAPINKAVIKVKTIVVNKVVVVFFKVSILLLFKLLLLNDYTTNIKLFFNTQTKKQLFLLFSIFFWCHLCNYMNARTGTHE
jgi:hypothetical protein